MKFNNPNKLIINSELKQVISDILSKNPQTDQSRLIDMIVSQKKTRLSRQNIKSGVEAYFNHMNKQQQTNNGTINLVNSQPNKNKSNGSNGMIDWTNVQQKPSKKIKKNQFLIDFEDNLSFKFSNLGGISQVYSKIKSQFFTLIEKDTLYKSISKVSPNRGFLLCGSPGSGKTILANCILSYLIGLQNKKISAFSVNSLDFLSGDADQKFKKLFQAAQEKIPAVIFIDNLQELCSKDNNKRMQSLPSLTLYNYINKIRDKEIYILGATSSPQKLDLLTKPGIFYKQIKINNPDEQQRTEIIQKTLAFYNHNLASNMKELSLMTAGYVAVDIISLFKQAALRCVERASSLQSPPQIQEKQGQTQKAQILINIEDVRNAFKEIQPILKKDGFAKIPNVKLEDVGALQNIKEQLTQEIIMPLKQQQKFRNMNFQVSGGGILLYGPPGCGKTMIAKAIANQANANFITVKGPQLLTKYVGQSEQAVRKVFERARLSAPCIIFFDQFDALAPKRQDQGNQVTERVVNTLLNELNGVDDRKMVFVIAATNRPDIIDQAILRSGRIEKHLYVPLPNQKQRYEILVKITRKVNHQDNLQLQNIAANTENFSGADLYFLVKKSIISAVANNRNKIEADDIRNALSTYKKDKYNKGNRLKLSQFEEEEQVDKKDYLSLNENNQSMKKAKSQMEVEINQPKQKPKASKRKENLLNSFIEHLLNLSKNQKAFQNLD